MLRVLFLSFALKSCDRGHRVFPRNADNSATTKADWRPNADPGEPGAGTRADHIVVAETTPRAAAERHAPLHPPLVRRTATTQAVPGLAYFDEGVYREQRCLSERAASSHLKTKGKLWQWADGRTTWGALLGRKRTLFPRAETCDLQKTDWSTVVTLQLIDCGTEPAAAKTGTGRQRSAGR